MRELKECKECGAHGKIVGDPGKLLSYVYCNYGGMNYKNHKKAISRTLKIMDCPITLKFLVKYIKKKKEGKKNDN
jgi:hypothetical protein